MISRRQILQGGLVATSLPIIAGVSLVPLQAAHAEALAHPRLYKVLFDRRFAESRDFGHEAVRQGHSVQGFDGDMTAVWYHDLQPRWQEGPIAIAGLTAHGALFCLERLAWDVGMRVTHRAEQRHKGREPLYSWVIAPRAA